MPTHPRFDRLGTPRKTGPGAGLWSLGPGTDPFGGPARPAIPFLDRLPLFAEAGRPEDYDYE